MEATQLEEQYGFQQGGKIQGRLLTANACLQTIFAANALLWIISAHLSKAFDKIDWNALVSGGRDEMSPRLIWILQCVHCRQTGVVREHDTDSCGFDIRGGVRQGCVLSPRLHNSALEPALSSRAQIEADRFSLEDSLKLFLHLRFADDTFAFCITLDKECLLLDELVASLAGFGGATVDVMNPVSTHKWLACRQGHRHANTEHGRRKLPHDRMDIHGHGYGHADMKTSFEYIVFTLQTSGGLNALFRQMKPNWHILCQSLSVIQLQKTLEGQYRWGISGTEMISASRRGFVADSAIRREREIPPAAASVVVGSAVRCSSSVEVNIWPSFFRSAVAGWLIPPQCGGWLIPPQCGGWLADSAASTRCTTNAKFWWPSCV